MTNGYGTVNESPGRIARLAGFFYLLNFAFMPGFVAMSKYVVLNDAAATAAHVMAHSTLFQLGFAGHLIATAAYLVVTALFYALFKPVNATMSLLASFLSVVACAILAVAAVFYIAPVTAIGNALGLAVVFFRLYSAAYGVSLFFFGCYCLTIGYLAFKSTFVPRALGAGMMLAGSGWMMWIAPLVIRSLYPYILISGLGELALALWLLIFGVNTQRWKELSS
jgi:hypothetical protein